VSAAAEASVIGSRYHLPMPAQTLPTRKEQGDLHRRVLAEDPTAFAELCEAALPHLVESLHARFPNRDSHLIESTAIDVLMAYYDDPARFDPARLSLFGYLRMAARYDALNRIDSARRREDRLVPVDHEDANGILTTGSTVEDAVRLDEWLAQHTTLSRSEVLTRLHEALDPVDEEIVLMMLEGVRATERYAAVMGISHLDTDEQRAEVKRAKDRLNKKLRRFATHLIDTH
jgi:DNA-directed RNA polymerase specialized sigma24 family protein